MADKTSSEDKTEAASPRRIEKAREDGQVARSKEMNTFAMLLVGVVALWAMGAGFYSRLGQVMEQALLFDRSQAFDTARMLSAVWNFAEQGLLSLLPLFLLMVVTAIAASTLLGGLVISFKALSPKLSRLNPITGLGRLFSTKVLAELGKAVAKALLVGLVAFFFLKSHVAQLLDLSDMPIQQALASSMQLVAKACILIVMSLIVVVGLDVPFQLWTYYKNLRMSKEEQRQEHKESDGDPQLKARIRRQQQIMARSRMMSNVPTADVVITNPTHYSVALAYSDDMGAPRVVAKGADEIALRIRELAREHQIPLLEAPPLARALYFHVDLDHEIPGDLYSAVAEVLAWAFRLKGVNANGGTLPDTPEDLPVPSGMDQPGPRGSKSEETQH
jgi:flagellar biosynthetic protein FlhB